MFDRIFVALVFIQLRTQLPGKVQGFPGAGFNSIQFF